MARRIAFAIFLWFLGRRPVSRECFMRPISDMYSDMIVKFCRASASQRGSVAEAAHLVFGDGVDAQGVEDVARGRLAGQLPLLLLDARQVVRGVDVARVPLAVHVLLEALALAGGGEHGLVALGAALEGLCTHARGEGGVPVGGDGLGGGAVGRRLEDVEDVDGCGRVSRRVSRRRGRGGGRVPLGRAAVVEKPLEQALEQARDAATAERMGIWGWMGIPVCLSASHAPRRAAARKFPR